MLKATALLDSGQGVSVCAINTTRYPLSGGELITDVTQPFQKSGRCLF